MKTILVITTILTLSIGSCSQNKSERVKQTAIDRYCIVYKGEKFGIYDNVADSLVTDLKYDSLKYRRHVFENDTDIYILRAKDKLDAKIIERATYQLLDFCRITSFETEEP